MCLNHKMTFSVKNTDDFTFNVSFDVCHVMRKLVFDRQLNPIFRQLLMVQMINENKKCFYR